MKSVKAIPVALTFFASICPDSRAAEIVACDLIQRSAVSALIGEEIKQHTPSQDVQSSNGVKSTDCLFFGRRNRLRVILSESPDASAAAKNFSEATTNSDFAKFASERGIGDKVAWWKGGREAYGYTVLKGRRILVLAVHAEVPSEDAGLKQKLKPIVVEAVQKM